MRYGTVIVLAVILLQYECDCVIDPYQVLGVKRSDPPQLIKSAYRKLAKEWHPDKNNEKYAEAEMIKLNEAYEILSNPEKKEQYDAYGTVGENQQQDAHHHFHHEFRRGHSFVFDDSIFGSNFHSHARRKTNVLTQYSYQNIVLPDSYHKIFLISIYGEFCFECLRIQPIWDKVSENLDNIGVGIYELNYDRDPYLARDIGVQGYPQFVAVAAGRAVRYKSNEISERTLRDFISSLLPPSLIEKITENQKGYFEQSFKDNKPQCLLFSKHLYAPLLFEIVAYEYRSKVKFAYIDVRDLRTKQFREKYHINAQDPAVVIVKEEPSSPVVVARGSALKRGTLRELVSSNLYFYVPRLSSQEIYDELCLKKSSSQRWLCLALIVRQESNYSTHLWKLRQMAKRDKFKRNRIQFFYIFGDIQTDFMNSFENDASTVPCSDGAPPLNLLIMSRLPVGDKTLYDWFPNGWCSTGNSMVELETYLDDLVNNNVRLKYVTKPAELKDEHWHGAVWDFVKKTYATVQHIVDSIDSPNWYNASSIALVALVVFGIFISCVIPLASELISDKPSAQLPQHNPSTEKITTVLGIQKLDIKSEEKFIHKAQSGQITVAVIVDSSMMTEIASSPIIQAYADAIYGHTGNPNYTFTWLSITENLMWCTEIMSVKKFGEFLPGTVLAMNGFRKYVYIFKGNIELKSKATEQLSAKFIGLESSDDDDDTYEVLERQKIKKAAVHIRSELPRWLERLFDGTLTNKIKIEKWPKMDS